MSTPRTHLFNILGDEWDVRAGHFCCTPTGFQGTEAGGFRCGFGFHIATNLQETTAEDQKHSDNKRFGVAHTYYVVKPMIV